jgi:hypothetical protein
MWCRKPLHPYIPQKNVMDPWPAPYQNSNDYWCFTYDQKTSGNFQQTWVIFTVSTQYYTKGPYKGNCRQIPGAASTVQQRCIFTPVHGQKQIPTLLHFITYTTKTGFTPCHSTLYNTKVKFYNSCTKENWTGQPYFLRQPKPQNGVKFTLTCPILTPQLMITYNTQRPYIPFW